MPSCAEYAADAGATELSEIALVDPGGWLLHDADDDPLASHRPPTLACDVSPVWVERGNLEIDTNVCEYVSIHQASLGSVNAGDPVLLGLYHYDLTAPEPAEAHVAVLFGDQVQWQTTIDIPGPAQVLDTCFMSTRPLAAGEQITLHLHNHGQNTWTLTRIGRLSR